MLILSMILSPVYCALSAAGRKSERARTKLDGVRVQVNIIDFGSACFCDEQGSMYVQSRFYRSPEVYIFTPAAHYSHNAHCNPLLTRMCAGSIRTAIQLQDRHVVFRLYFIRAIYRSPEATHESACVFTYHSWTGRPLFTGKDGDDQLKKICTILGQPSPAMVKQSSARKDCSTQLEGQQPTQDHNNRFRALGYAVSALNNWLLP